MYCERYCSWSLCPPSVVTYPLFVLYLPSCVEVIALCIGFVPWLCAHLLCWGCILCGVLSEESWNPSRWGGDVELGARTANHIFLFAFGYLSKLYSLYILHCYYCSFIHARYCLCAHTCIDPRKLLEHLNSHKREILRRSRRALHRKFSFTLWI